MKPLAVLFLLFTAAAFSQSIDSLKIKPVNPAHDTVNTARNDTLSVSDSLKAKASARVDTLAPIYQQPFDSQGSFINRKDYDFTDYLYSGDLLREFNFNFIADYGSIGQPNETFLYGTGFNGISYFENGILRNNRFQNILDLNNLQSELIDSIEVIPLPRGFLYGTINNPVSVNFLARDFITPKPYSRIKYYQGPSGEAMLDVMFNEMAFNKFNFTLDVTNRKLDSTFTKPAYSIWQVTTGLKYFLSDNINLIGTYSFTKSLVGLNGGINVDSIKNETSDINSLLYDQQLAPVNFNAQNQGYKNHLFNLRMLAKFWNGSFTDLNLYYNFDYTELNRFVDSSFYKTVDKEKIFGASLRQDFRKGIFNFSLIGNYESGNLKYYSLTNSSFNYYPVNYHNASLSAVASTYFFDSTLIPSVYYKITSLSGNDFLPQINGTFGVINGTFSGMGADLTYKTSDLLKFYLGYSSFKTGKQFAYSQNWEAGLSANSNNFFADIKLFRQTDTHWIWSSTMSPAMVIYNPDLMGFGARLNFSFWKILVETNTSIYAASNLSNLPLYLPKLNFTGGIYYKNILFKENLNLKTGFVFYYTGQRNSLVGELNPVYKIDFTAVGLIQKVAYVYFTWENLTDNQYYIIPYYPMLPRNIRFGIAWELFN